MKGKKVTYQTTFCENDGSQTKIQETGVFLDFGLKSTRTQGPSETVAIILENDGNVITLELGKFKFTDMSYDAQVGNN
jgi:hypothetical protein